MSKGQHPTEEGNTTRPSCAPIEEGCMSLPPIAPTNTSPKSGCDFEIGWNGARSRKSSRCSIKSIAPSISSTTTLPSIDRGKSQSVNSIRASSPLNALKDLERVELVRSPSCPELGYEIDEPHLVKNGDLGASIHPSMFRNACSKKPEGGQKGLFKLPSIFGKSGCTKTGALINDTAQEVPNIFVPSQSHKRAARQDNEKTKNPHNSLAPLDTTTEAKKKSKRRHKRKNRKMNPENELDIPENVETLSLVSHGTPVGEIKFDGERFESAGTRVIETVAIENGKSQEYNRSSTMSFTRSMSKAEIAIHN
ncbi:unnamed protein product [Owenia fusiformis]|uniref:Uncharacterized protein n=1 Tax=Owenia fusiformis TaxID=6347 RepID=A0A8J1UMI7_OWEFU|nr:unnamed protein product [Owenia fusiformis]